MISDIRRVGQHATIYANVRNEYIMECMEEHAGEVLGYAEKETDGKHLLQLHGTENRVTMSAHQIASVDVERATLRWRWAENALENDASVPNGANIAAAMRAWGEENELPSFSSPEVPYELSEFDDEDFDPAEAAAVSVAGDVGDSAFEIFGENSSYVCIPTDDGDTWRVFLIDGYTIPIPIMDLDALFVRIGRLVTECDDPAWSIEGIAYQREDWTVEEIAPESKQQAWKIADFEGRYFVVELSFDEDGNIAEIAQRGIFNA